MTKAIPVADWVCHIDSEYLSTFIKDSGGAVKFAVTANERMPDLVEKLQALCTEQEHLYSRGQTSGLSPTSPTFRGQSKIA